MITSTVPTPRQLIPDPAFAEYHSRRLDVAPEAAGLALHGVRCRDVSLLGLLMTVRNVPARITGRGFSIDRDRLLKDQLANGFVILSEAADGYLFVTVGQPFKLRPGPSRRPASIEEFVAFDEPGFCRIAADFRIVESGGRTIVSTETVVDCTDPVTRRAFARYWRVIRPFSGLIRHSMLAAVHRAAGTGA